MARAALESIALQVDAVVRVMDGTTAILADGGATASNVLMQLQADISGIPVRRARERDLSAIGPGCWPRVLPGVRCNPCTTTILSR